MAGPLPPTDSPRTQACVRSVTEAKLSPGISDRARECFCVVIASLVLGAAAPLLAQSDAPDDVPVRFKSLALLPTVRLTHVGWDDNVLHMSTDQHPTGDFTGTVTPSVQAWLGLARVRVRGQSDVDFVYFRELTEFNSVDAVNNAHVELSLGRLTPYVGGTWANTRHRRDFEIDVPVRRLETSSVAGADVRLTGKTSVGLMTRGSHVDYKGDTVYFETDLAQYLGATARATGARVQYAATPLTTIGANVERYRNRFVTAPERDSDGLRVTATAEVQPLARVSGRAEVGVTRRTFVDGKFPKFQGIVGRVDLGYTVFERTRFAVGAQRDLAYSYRADQRDYLQAGIELSVTHRLANAWDVRGTVSRFTLGYGLGDSPAILSAAGESRAERIISYGGEVGYRVGGTRVGFEVARQARTSDFAPNRRYEQTQIFSSLSYEF
jgi:hypothetical protein